MNSTVKKATLSLFFQQGTVGVEYTYACAFVKQWEEMAVTWLKCDQATDWNLPGGDFDSATITATGYAQEYSWEHYDVTAVVQRHVSGASNYGLYVFPDQKEGNTGREYCSSEYSGGDSLRPKLTVVYENTGISPFAGHAKAIKQLPLCKTGRIVRFLTPSAQMCRIAVYKPSGGLLQEVRSRGGEWFSIDCSGFSSGVYGICIIAENASYYGRFAYLR